MRGKNVAPESAVSATLGKKVQGLLLKHPDEFFLMGIQVLTFAIMGVAVTMSRISTIHWLSFSFPCCSCYCQFPGCGAVMNTCVTTLLPPSILPKARLY